MWGGRGNTSTTRRADQKISIESIFHSTLIRYSSHGGGKLRGARGRPETYANSEDSVLPPAAGVLQHDQVITGRQRLRGEEEN